MRDLKLLLGLLLFVIATTRPVCGQDKIDRSVVEKLFRETEARFDSAQSLQYTVSKTTRMDRRTVEERWTLFYEQPDLLRVDYHQPIERLLVMNAEDMWEYIPAARKAVRTRLSKLSDEKRTTLLASVLGRVSVDGLRLGDYRDMIQRAVSVRTTGTNSETYIVEGQDPRFVVEIDASRHALLRTEIYDTKGKLKIRTVSSAFSEIISGFWFPSRIQATYWSAGGYVVSDFSLIEAQVNGIIAPPTFQFTPREGIAVVEN
jgi:outer membrane lipoprotein-sorting protein